MYSAIIVNVSNILFKLPLLIFGALGFPKMGIAGAGCSSAISNVLGFLFSLGVTSCQPNRKHTITTVVCVSPEL